MIGLLYTYTYCSDAVAPCVRELYVYVYSCTCTRRAIGEVRCRVVHILYHMYMYIATYSTVQMCMAYGTSGSNSGSISVLPYSKLYTTLQFMYGSTVQLQRLFVLPEVFPYIIKQHCPIYNVVFPYFRTCTQCSKSINVSQCTCTQLRTQLPSKVASQLATKIEYFRKYDRTIPSKVRSTYTRTIEYIHCVLPEILPEIILPYNDNLLPYVLIFILNCMVSNLCVFRQSVVYESTSVRVQYTYVIKVKKARKAQILPRIAIRDDRVPFSRQRA